MFYFNTVWKVSKYRVFSASCFFVLGVNTDQKKLFGHSVFGNFSRSSRGILRKYFSKNISSLQRDVLQKSFSAQFEQMLKKLRSYCLHIRCYSAVESNFFWEGYLHSCKKYFNLIVLLTQRKRVNNNKIYQVTLRKIP